MQTIRIAFHTLGCKTNHYETDAIAGQFRLHGFEQVDFQQEADVYLINTCTVTGEADRKSRQLLRRAGQRNPDALVVAMGCHAELSDTSHYADLCIGTQGKSQAVVLVKQALEAKNGLLAGEKAASPTTTKPTQGRSYEDISEYEELGLSDRQSETRAYLKIEDGCNAFCSYCAIPLARGRVRSRDEHTILQEASALAKAGYKEIVLTGIHLCSYGLDRGLPGHAVAQLAVRLAAIEGIERIRLGSLEPLSITSEFLRTLQESPKICPHFHLSLQSGCDRTLEAMNRRYRTDQFQQVVDEIRSIWPSAGLTTDIITGFPGETDEDFEQSLQFCRQIQFMRMHIFRYSAREGTRAASMPNPVSPSVAAVRSNRMQQLATELSFHYHRSLLGCTVQVLTEQISSDGSAHGYTATYVPVVVRPVSDQTKANQLLTVRINEVEADFVAGLAVKPTDFMVR